MYFRNLIVFSLFISVVLCAPQIFETSFFKVGIEYDHSLPMTGGSDRYRHRNNYDPFFVTVTATAKKGYVISYVEVSATVDEGGLVEFTVLRGDSGSRNLVFQLVSNRSDFLKYSYLAYGIKEEEFKKISNIINISINNGIGIRIDLITLSIFILLYTFLF